MNTKKLSLTTIILAMLALGIMMGAFGLVVGRAQAPKPKPTLVPAIILPEVTPTATETPRQALASISGRVWHDLCAVGGGEGGIVLAPSTGCVPASAGGYEANGLIEAGEPALAGVFVQLGVGNCPALGLAEVATDQSGSFAFGGLTAGTYCVSVDALNPKNEFLLPGGWTLPAVKSQSSVASYTVTVLEDEQRSEINFGWDFQFLPPPEPVPTQLPQATPTAALVMPTATPAATQTPVASGGCTDKVSFVADVTIPDNTRLLPGQSFVKTWRLRNNGTCTWDTDYALVFAGGDRLGGPSSVPLARPVAPGNSVDLSIALTAPTGYGSYEGKWQLRNADGELFGLGRNVNGPFWVKIVVGPAPTPTPTPPTVTNWRGEYYANRNLSGIPVLVRDDAAVNYNWGATAPATGLPTDGFSVRWSRTLALQAGAYRFYAASDDGVRVWLDGELIIDQWHDAANVLYHAERTLGAGDHMLRVEYYENLGAASIRFWWERQGASAYWRGAYFPTIDLTGTPTLVRDDTSIDFNWGSGSPFLGLSMDGFSVRWTRTSAFEGGLYRFRATVDDGVRLWVDDALVIDAWHDGGRREVRADFRLSPGDHLVRVEYYERTGEALIQVSWEKLDTAYPDWRGEYWSNVSLSGSPTLVRNDVDISFNWGRGAPAVGIDSDGFSARWMRTMAFDEGLFRFHVIVDDGARLWVDDTLVVNTWTDGGRREVTGDYRLSGGYHALRVEYYERAGDALIQVWWEKVNFYSDWKAEYWSNPNLSGTPTLVRNDVTIDFNWRLGSPAPNIPADNFSARWTRTAEFDAATYRFHVIVDDGARLWVDDRLLIGAWRSGAAREVTADLPLVQGKHSLRLEYYEGGDNARIQLWWEKTTPASYPDWKGEFWSSPNLSGMPALVRNDSAINFHWGQDAAASGLPADYFSARWSRQVTFEPGTYLFNALADDGIRVYLDDQLLLNEWHKSDGKDVYAVSRPLTGGHKLVVEYYETSGEAQVKFWWKRVGELPTPTAAPNRPPVAADDAVTIDEDSAVGINVLSNDSDPDGDSLSISDYQTASTQGGRVSCTSAGVCTYTPRSNFNGTDSFTYTASDGEGGSDTATVTVTVKPVNDPPVAVDDAATTDEDTAVDINVLSNDFDPDGDSLSISDYQTASTQGGRVSCTSAGVCTYTPRSNFNGTDSFTYTASDGKGGSDTAIITVTVKAKDSPPTPVPGGVRLNEILPEPSAMDWDGNGTADERDEWIELYNTGSITVELGGWIISDSIGTYVIPEGTVLEAGALVVFFRPKTDIRLNDSGGVVRLLDPAGEAVDSVAYGPLGPDTSYSRDWAGEWHPDWPPSPGTVNTPSLPVTISQLKNGTAR